MSTFIPRTGLHLDFTKMALLSGDDYPDELSKLPKYDSATPLLNFARSTAGGRFNAAGTFEMVAAGQPRFHFDQVTRASLGLLLEASRTNLCLQSANFGVTWFLTGGITRTAAADTSIGINLDRLIAVNTSGADNYSQTLSGLSTTASNVISAFVKKHAGTAISRIGIYDATTSAFLGRLSINWATMAVTALDSATLLSAAVIGTGVERVAFKIPAVISGHAIQVYIYPDATASQSGLLIGGVQVESADDATSYIPTTTAAVTSGTDYAYLNAVDPWYNLQEGTWVVSVVGVPSSATTRRNLINAQTGTDAAYSPMFSVEPGDYVRCIFIDGGTYAFDVAPGALSSRIKLAARYKSGSYGVSLNGGAVTTGASALLPSKPTYIGIGSHPAGGDLLNGCMSRLSYYPWALSDGQLKQQSSI